jgi:hypothetical protein
MLFLLQLASHHRDSEAQRIEKRDSGFRIRDSGRDKRGLGIQDSGFRKRLDRQRNPDSRPLDPESCS